MGSILDGAQSELGDVVFQNCGLTHVAKERQKKHGTDAHDDEQSCKAERSPEQKALEAVQSQAGNRHKQLHRL